MKKEKLYRVKSPLGNVIVPKDLMNEEELRDFFPQIVQDPAVVDIWMEKAMKDPIMHLVELLQRADYSVEIVEINKNEKE